MKCFFRKLVFIMSFVLIFTACAKYKSFYAEVIGVDKIDIEGAKAIASLSGFAMRAGGNETGESLLYAIDEENNIVLPKISCNFIFGDEMTETERQNIIKDMNATIETSGIYDFGPYIIVRYNLAYTSSYEVKNGLGEINVSISYIHSAIRKSDGKSFNIGNNNLAIIHELLNQLEYGFLKKSVAVSESEVCLICGDNIIKVSEHGDEILISMQTDNLPDLDVLKDRNGNVYIFRNGEIVTYDGEVPLEGSYNMAAQMGNQVYAFTLENEMLKVYLIQDGKRQLDAEIAVDGNFVLGQYIGNANGEILWRDANLVRYNPTTKTLNSKELGLGINELIWQNTSMILNEYAFCARQNGNGVEVVKINLIDETQEIIPIDIPNDKVVEGFRFTGSAASDYLQLYIYCQSGKHIIYNVQGASDLPDLTDYEVHKVIPLKQ